MMSPSVSPFSFPKKSCPALPFNSPAAVSAPTSRMKSAARQLAKYPVGAREDGTCEKAGAGEGYQGREGGVTSQGR